MHQRLKSAARCARARIIPTEFLDEFLGAAHNAIATFNMGLGREGLSTFATDLESNQLRGVRYLFA
jgi:hypothetical protein